MSELKETITDPLDPAELVDWIQKAARKVNYGISFGDPTDTEMDGPNGRTGNIDGRWVKTTINAAIQADGTTPVTFTHNLEAAVTADTTAGDKCNVLWPIVNARHDADGATATTPSVNLDFVDGDTCEANSVQLRVRAVGRTVDNSHPMELVVWFQKVTPW